MPGRADRARMLPKASRVGVPSQAERAPGGQLRRPRTPTTAAGVRRSFDEAHQDPESDGRLW